jgi:murein DD-endopeptidase MepM/ murein hydrolase activator NlpD
MGSRIVPLAVVAVALLVQAAPAQAPARAGAVAQVASGDLGTVARAEVRDDGRDAASDSAARPGLEIAGGRTAVRASRAGGRASARASATAARVSLFGGLVTARRVSRTATASDGRVNYEGSITGLVVNGQDFGDKAGEHTWTSGGARVTANRAGEGLRVRLTRPVAGFATGTTVVVARVEADAIDGADPAATPTPAPTPTPEPEPRATPEPTPAKPKITPAQRLARGRFVFPVYGDARVADDFGAPRHIGAHQGNDIFAAFGSPVLAVADGTLNRVGTLPISGNRLWLKTERGDSFFYAHLSAFGPEAVSGRKVEAGTLLGFVGNTGDAEPTPPHVHFEIHPGGKKAIDPHAVLTAWQARGVVPADGWLARYGNDTEARPGALVEVRDFIAGE